jgi:Protein of unknown function (DUF2844)
MKTSRFRYWKLAFAGLLAGSLIAGRAIPVRAGLGGDDSSVESDAAALKGKMSELSAKELAQSDSYSIRTFVSANGISVREYVARAGPIFGIAWEGCRPPDLSVLLGSYYAEYVWAAGLKQHINLHRDVIEGSHAIVSLRGRMGRLIGRAYVPTLAPLGVDANAVVK